MASGIYNELKADLMNKNRDMINDDFKVALMDDNHAFNDTHINFSDVSGNEISGTGYTAGGETLSNKSVTKGSTTKWDADDVSWTDADFSAYHAVIYASSSGNLIASIDFGGEQTVSNGEFKIEWDADGIITLS